MPILFKHSALLAFLSLSIVGILRADMYWEFNDAANRVVERSVDASGSTGWTGDLGQSMTTGRGTLQLRSVGQSKGTAYVPLGELAEGQVLWMLVKINGWRLSGSGIRELSVGFSERIDPHRSVLQLELRGSSSRGLYLTGAALRSEEGAANTNTIRLGEGEQTTPVTLVLEYHPNERTFNVHSVKPDGSLALLGSGLTSPKRNARFLHIYIKGELGASEGEFVDLDSIIVAGDRAGLFIDKS